MNCWLSARRCKGLQLGKMGLPEGRGMRTFLELLKVWMMPISWLCDLRESLSLSELQLATLGYKTTTSPSCVV